MNTSEQKRLLGIICFVAAVASTFVLVDLAVKSGPDRDRSRPRSTERMAESTEPIRKQAGPMKSPEEATWALEKQTGDRTIMEYLDRRSYPGAPPVIPHEVDENALNDPHCQSCHEEGGFTEEFDAFAPVTPHLNDEMQN